MVKNVLAKKGGKAQKKINIKYSIDCKLPVGDNVIVLGDFESFLKTRVKVEGKAGNLGNNVTISKDKDSVVVSSKIPFSKRYLKYLTKKYLKKQDLKEYLRVVATDKTHYQMRYFNVNNDEEQEEE